MTILAYRSQSVSGLLTHAASMGIWKPQLEDQPLSPDLPA